MDQLFHLWVYLETTPLLGLAATLLAYRAAVVLSRLASGHAPANPVLIAIALLAGLVASLLIGPAMALLRVSDWRAQGLAAGTAGHGLATARMLPLSETAGAFGGLAIGLNGIITVVVVPLLAGLLAGP